jgi:ribosomal protein S27E
MFFIIGFILMAIPPAVGQTNPPTSGDWVIKDRVTQEHKMIILRGDLIIENSGDLRLRNVDLRFNCAEDFEYKIKVRAGGRFEVFDSSVSSQSYHPYMIVVESGGEFAIHNSNVTRYCTTKTIDDETSGGSILMLMTVIIVIVVVMIVTVFAMRPKKPLEEVSIDERAKPKKKVGSKFIQFNCPKCGKEQTANSTKGTIDMHCSICGMHLVLKK